MAATPNSFPCISGRESTSFHSTTSGTFFNDGRIIWFWRKSDTIQYSLQGQVGLLPQRYMASASPFYGMWDEAGTVPDLEEALKFFKAWLIDKKEVDDLPQRNMRRGGIG